MTTLEIDQYLGQTPCLCGNVTTWHGPCYAGKTDKQIEDAYRRVYACIRRLLYLQRRELARNCGNPKSGSETP